MMSLRKIFMNRAKFMVVIKMKNLAYILLFFTQILFAQSAFQKGNDAYKKGNYQEAVQLYESILKEKKESAEVYFNLGNAYYKLHKVAPAIYNYEKALLLKPNDKDVKVNLEFAQRMVIDDIKEVPQAGFSRILYGWASTYHYDTWAWITVGCSFSILLFFIGYYFAGTTLLKRGFFVAMFVGLLFAVISVLSAVFIKSEGGKKHPAIVFSEVASVKSEPVDNAPDTFILHEGTKVYVIETLDNWNKIHLADDSEGWIESSNIKELKAD